MNKILGLDLGTNSIGWAIRNPDLTGNQIEKFGVLTFNKGVGIDKTGEYSFAAERTKKRSTRRLYQSRKYRLWATLEHLINYGYCPLSIEDLNKWRHYNKEEAQKNNNSGRIYPITSNEFESWIKLDFNEDGKPDYTSPYQLRKELAKNKLDFNREQCRYKLGRALYHIAQRRGFKSSRKGSNDTKENEINDFESIDLQYSEKKKNKIITEQFNKFPEAKTIGWLFALLEDDKVRIRENISQYAIRENYKEEIKYIFNRQGLNFDHPLYLNLIESASNRNDGSIFYKRPLRSQKGLVGLCTLEQDTRIDKKTGKQFQTGKYRAPISHPAFERFRAWSFINNIKYKSNTEESTQWQNIPFEIKHKIYEEKFFRKSKGYFPFSEIEDLIKISGKNWRLNYSSRTTVMGCPVSGRLKDILGENYLTVQIVKPKAPNSTKAFYDLEDIWHVLFNYEDQEYVADFAEQKLKLNPEKVKSFITAWNALPVGYGMLSLNAINKINRFLEKGLIYTEAVLLANLPEIMGEEIWTENENLLLENIKEVIEKNRRQKILLLTVNNLISQHKNLEREHQFGFKDDSYKLDLSDLKDIQQAIIENFGERRWNDFNESEQENIKNSLKDCYQAYFHTTGFPRKDFNNERYFEVKSGSELYYKTDSGYYRLPKLIDTLKEFLEINFSLVDRQLKKIFHPSEIYIYPTAKPDKNGVLKLGSPKTGSFKNPMAMRTMHELRKLMNYLIETSQIDSDTRIVVEVARELNDSNKRWAIAAWQRQRESENQEFAEAIIQLLENENGIKADAKNENDIDKVRLFYDQNDEQTLPPVIGIEGSEKQKRKIINQKDETIRWTGYGNKLIDKYRLWQEQGYRCIYTGKIIKLSDLFQENVIDFEHTIPRSKSFDNSLANRTVCYHDYNRTIKRNQIPTKLINYEKDYEKYTAILPRLTVWKEKIERIKQQIDFWKTKSKKASEKIWKDDAIRQRLLWQMEYDYWKNKYDRFTITEITTGFKNSQKVDTQLISKYAFHYLKTYFDKVDVQKGSVTAMFRKIYQLQEPDEKKNRGKHSHHAKDAAVLTLIPIAAKRDLILEKYYKSQENQTPFTDNQPYNGFKREFISGIDKSVFINNITNDQALTISRRKIRKRGKEQFIPGTNTPMLATGSSIRGQLHQETFYGAIKPAKKGEMGNLLKDDNGKFIQEEKERYVLRVPFTSEFNNIDKIVDEGLKKQLKEQIQHDGNFKNAFEEGIYLLDKSGKPHGNKIRHIRIWASVTEPLSIKKQTHLSRKDYKQYYWAANGENLICAFYKNDNLDKDGKIKKNRDLEIINLMEAAALREYGMLHSKGEPDIYKKNKNKELMIDANGNKISPYAILKTGLKVIFYEEKIDELKKSTTESNDEYKKRISDRTYRIIKFTGGRLTFQHHLEARTDKDLEEKYPVNQIFKTDNKNNEISYGGRGKSGFTEKVIDALKCNGYNNYEPWPRLLYSVDWLDMAIEGKDFNVNIDGTLKWLKDLV